LGQPRRDAVRPPRQLRPAPPAPEQLRVRLRLTLLRRPLRRPQGRAAVGGGAVPAAAGAAARSGSRGGRARLVRAGGEDAAGGVGRMTATPFDTVVMGVEG